MLSRIFRGENDNAADKRRRQIDTLKIFNDHVLELQQGVEYQVQFMAGEKRMAIMVSLSPEFPLEKPVLRVSPPITHKWCNEHSEIVSAPGLLNFTVHSDLGRVVQAIIREFSKNPPKVIEDNSPVSIIPLGDLAGRGSPSYIWNSCDLSSANYDLYYNPPTYPQYSSSAATPSIYNFNYSNASNAYNGLIQHQQQQQPQQYAASQPYVTNLHYANANVQVPAVQNQVQYKSQKPTCPEFPELDNMTKEELIKLSKDDDLLDEILEKHPKLKEFDTAVEDAITTVENMASANLAREQELQELKEDVAGKVQEIESLRSRYDELSEQYKKLSEVFSPLNICDSLRKAADESQEQSESIAQDFLNRKIDVERFLSTYVECRKLGQARRTKEEKLAHQLNEIKRT